MKDHLDEVRYCIWCRKSSENTTFKTKAHTVPDALGGVVICKNVCDVCNSYFGNSQNGMPSIETVIKETFGMSRVRLLQALGELGKNKKMARYKSRFFNVTFNPPGISIKPAYKLKKGFQGDMCRLLKRGLYKIFLEENERNNSNSIDQKYTFIREFARYDLNDLPVLYFKRAHGILFLGKDMIVQPHMPFEEITMNYLIRDLGFFEVELMGHTFSIATTSNWQLYFEEYIKESMKLKVQHFVGYKSIIYWNDIDLSLSVIDKSQ